SLAECLVKPLELGQSSIVQTYLGFLQPRRFLTIVPITRDLLIEAAKLRATTRLKLPDAIHAATARWQNCTFFVTNDDRFRVVPGIQMLHLRDLEEK
ncbi:MAG: PIN domain-containing protein, partial [Deltaproteobacteria bacterium]|nr:PIN domain-containing protein [Deltaproteobacteria bacterium]